MSTKMMEQKIADLDKRLAVVEANAARPKESAWLKHAGWAANDPLFDEAVRLGAEWRARENQKARRHAGRR